MNNLEKKELQIDFGLKFANYLVNKKYKEAFFHLSLNMKKNFSIARLENEMLSMIDYFYNPHNIWVCEEFVREDECAVDDNYIYIPINGDGESEAIYIEIDYVDNELVILDLEFGRP